MKIDVFQCELDKKISLEYLGRVRYEGKSFGVDSLTDGKEYDIVVDKNNYIKVVDDSGEDYFYDLNNPGPADGTPKGKFIIIDDPNNELKNYIN